MKLKGGYLPRIAGRPSSKIFEVPVPEKLVISLRQFRLSFDPLVDEGKLVDFGTQLACATIGEGNERYIYMDLAGWAWVKFHPVPLLYPVENKRILNRLIRREIHGI